MLNYSKNSIVMNNNISNKRIKERIYINISIYKKQLIFYFILPWILFLSCSMLIEYKMYGMMNIIISLEWYFHFIDSTKILPLWYYNKDYPLICV